MRDARISTTSSQRILVLLLAALAACSGDSGQTADAAVGSRFDASPNFGPSEGIISIRAITSANMIYLDGYLNDGPDLELRVESQRIGVCRLMTFTPSFCDPACTNFDLCVDSQCRSSPTRLNKGAITWTWPGGQTTVQPDGVDRYSASGTFSQHGESSLTVEGNTVSVDSLENLEQVGDWADLIANRSGDAVLRWSNPVAGARVRLAMTDCVGSHGAIGASEIECEGPDTGELVLPSAFLDALDAGDWSRGECGSHEVVRYNTTSFGAGAFRFEAHSSGSFFYFPN